MQKIRWNLLARETGQSVINWRTGARTQHDFHIIKTAVSLPRDILNARINERVLQMMQAGQLAEAQALMPFRHLNALHTVGYSELFDYLDGKISLEQAIQLVAQHTRQYAKRQVTWFRKDPEFHWFDPTQADEILRLAGKKS
ncbi:MAG: hypothetical protein EOP04_15740 [Proteobacteria bacterium]|nr:MAG: hypothetical protein EOP04_15740 [Pseudomonadota bacterium]